MGQYIAINKEVEVNGQTILSVVKGMPGYETTALNILAGKGIKNPQEETWYSQQAWLDAFKEIAEKIGTNTLRSIGAKIIESAKWPPTVNSVETALSSIDIAYHMNHRIAGKALFDGATGKLSEGIGHYTFEKIRIGEYKVTCENPYPCDFDKGLLKGAVEKFKIAGQRVEFMENVKVGCRNNGSAKCTYHVIVK
jgi:hypothetical protein